MGDFTTAEQNPGEMDCRSRKRGKVGNGPEGVGRRGDCRYDINK